MLASSLFKLFPCCNPQKWCMSRKNVSCNLKLVPTAIVLLHVLSFVNIWERLRERRSPPSAFPHAHPSGYGSTCAVLQCLAGDAEHGHTCDLTSSSVGRSALSLLSDRVFTYCGPRVSWSIEAGLRKPQGAALPTGGPQGMLANEQVREWIDG